MSGGVVIHGRSGHHWAWGLVGELEHAASLWRRLIEAWHALPEADEDGESPLLDEISTLVDEWEAFVGCPTPDVCRAAALAENSQLGGGR